VLIVIDPDPGRSCIVRTEEASHAADLSVGKQGRVGLARCGLSEAYGVCLLNVCEFCERGAAIG